MELHNRIQAIGRHMVHVLSQQMKQGEITLSRAREIARFYLDKIRTAGDDQELTFHIETMMTELPEMHLVVRSEKMRLMRKEHDSQVQAI